jgi:hypothetical protein
MKLSISSSRARTIAGLVMFAGLAPFLLALIACLKVPVGNPERSRIDPALSGVWLEEDSQSGMLLGELWIIEPWDARTWIVTTLAAKDDDSADEAADEAAPTTTSDVITRLESNGLESSREYKAWLATFGGVRFLVLEPKRVVRDKAGMKPVMWTVFKVTQPTADRVKLLLVDGDEIVKAKTTAKAEAILRQHARDPALYRDSKEPQILRRVPEAEYGRMEELLKTLNIYDSRS